MPLYEYECKKCGHRFEKIQKFSDRMVKKCPECGGVVEQMISAPAVQFKGSGWYVTDYAKKSSGLSSSESRDAKDSKREKDEKAKSDGGAKESSSKESSSGESSSSSKDNSTKESSSKDTSSGSKDNSSKKSEKRK